MTRPRTLLAALTAAAGLVAPLAAQSPAPGPDIDASRAAWRWRRAITPGADATRALAAVDLPPELYAHAQADLRDLRLVDAAGHDVPYVIDRQAEREATPEWAGALSDVHREDKLLSRWQVDLGELRGFEQVWLDVPGSGFAKRVRVEVSDDARDWRLLRDDAGIFERDWSGSLRHTVIDLAAPAQARFLRLTVDDRRSAPIEVVGVRVRGVRRLAETRWERAAALVPGTTAGGHSRLRLELPPGLPLETVALDADDATFSRRVRLIEVTERDGRRDERVLGEARLFRLRLDDPALAGEWLRLDVRRPGRGELWLEIDDADSPPLRGLRARVSGVGERLLFPAAGGAVALYYGNERTRAPLYDLAALRARLGFARGFAEARLGEEEPNPRHAPAAPLAFVPATGAALDTTHWRFVRRFELGPAEDIFSLVLAPEDLGRLRDDLGDLRLCDAQGRQVPYVLEPGAVEARVRLAWEAEAARGPRRGAPGARPSRYRLVARAEADGAAPVLTRVARAASPLPMAALEVDFREGFFTRPARVLDAAESSGRERVLWSGVLARTAEAPRAPLELALGGQRHAALALEIDEGDNAALTPTSVQAVVRTPRLTFKAAPGEYRLLLGHDAAAPPRYDIATLRREVLAWSALPATPGALEDNPAFRRRAADYFTSAPPTVVMWAALLLAVVGLLLLTVRVLKKTDA